MSPINIVQYQLLSYKEAKENRLQQLNSYPMFQRILLTMVKLTSFKDAVAWG